MFGPGFNGLVGARALGLSNNLECSGVLGAETYLLAAPTGPSLILVVRVSPY